MRILVSFVLAMTVLSIAAQAPSPKPVDDAVGAPAAQIPAVKLEFGDPKPFPGSPSANAWVTPIFCTGDGTIVAAIPSTGADSWMPSFYALNTNGSHTFSPQSVSEIHDMQFMSYFASDSMYGVEVSGTRDDKQEMRTSRADKPAQKFYTGRHYQYVIEFDRDGSYKKTIELPEKYRFWRLIPLPDDDFVALAYDEANGVPRLLLLDSGCDVVRPIEIPQTMQDDPVLEQAQSSDVLKRARAESSMSFWYFGQARGKVLLYKPRAHASVLEIGSGGVLREVPLQSPDGYELGEVVPSDDRWIMRFRRSGLNDRGKVVDARPESGNFVYYEVDPNDGSLKRRIELPAKGLANIACEDDGVARGFTIGDGGKWLQITADLPR